MRLSLLLLLVGALLVRGNDYYISPGATEGDGTAEKPYGSFSEAFAASSGDAAPKIIAMTGTYNGAENAGLLVTSENGLTSLTLTSDNEADVTIDYEETVSDAFLSVTENISVSISNLKFANHVGHNLIHLAELSEATIVGCSFSHCGDHRSSSTKVVWVDGCDTFTLNSSTFQNCVGRGDGTAFYVYMTPGVIDSCEFTANDAGNDGDGAAIYVYFNSSSRIVATPNISNTIFKDNKARHGAAIYLSPSHDSHSHYSSRMNFVAQLKDVTFTNNKASRHGGAIYAEIGLNLTHATFESNSADETGGAMYVEANTYKNSECEECTFTSNSADDAGGAIWFSAGSIRVKRGDFTQNRLSSSRGTGGAIAIPAGGQSATITNTSFHSNQATEGGALYLGVRSTIEDCTFTKNGPTTNSRSTSYGGAVRIQDGELTLKACVFDTNNASRGAGVYAEPEEGSIGEIAVRGCTFKSNTAEEGAGAYFRDANSASVFNSVFEDNVASREGGGMRIRSNAYIYSSNFINNTAEQGGAMQIEDSEVFLTFGNMYQINNATRYGGALSIDEDVNALMTKDTFENNYAARDGGGLYLYRITRPVQVQNAKFLGNTARSHGHQVGGRSDDGKRFQGVRFLNVEFEGEETESSLYGDRDVFYVLDGICDVPPMEMGRDTVIFLCGCTQEGFTTSTLDTERNTFFIQSSLNERVSTKNSSKETSLNSVSFYSIDSDGCSKASNKTAGESRQIYNTFDTVRVAPASSYSPTTNFTGVQWSNFGHATFREGATLLLDHPLMNYGSITMRRESITQGDIVTKSGSTLELSYQNNLPDSSSVAKVEGEVTIGGKCSVSLSSCPPIQLGDEVRVLAWEEFEGKCETVTIEAEADEGVESRIRLAYDGMYVMGVHPKSDPTGDGGNAGWIVAVVLLSVALVGVGIGGFVYFKRQQSSDDYGQLVQ